MKAVLISIQPKWCKLIASGKKTVEVRKSRPKLETPFKVYIYCTQNTPYSPVIPMRYEKEGGNIYIGGKRYAEFLTGKVIGEFVCDNIINIVYDVNEYYGVCQNQTQIPYDELDKYLNTCMGYGWHISDLVIYDKPKELREFRRYPRTEHCGFGECELCRHGDYDQLDDEWFCRNYIARAPQSWCYVED